MALAFGRPPALLEALASSLSVALAGSSSSSSSDLSTCEAMKSLVRAATVAFPESRFGMVQGADEQFQKEMTEE